jgi:serine/threonine protein kinase
METKFSKLNISDKDTDTVNTKNCSYCNKLFTEELWCKECDPRKVIEGWSSGNPDIDKFIKDSMYDGRYNQNFLEWVPFDRFTDIKEIGEGGFAKVYSATWIDGKSYYDKQDDGSWEKQEPEPFIVALKRLNGSQNMSAEYLNEVCNK